MQDLEQSARHLLRTLRAMGKSSVADSKEAEYQRRGWFKIGSDDVAELIALVQTALSGFEDPDVVGGSAGEPAPPESARCEPDTTNAVRLRTLPQFASQVAEPIQSTLPDDLKALSHLEPFVLSIVEGNPTASIRLLRNCIALHACSTASDVVDTTRRIFVEQLGFESDPVDELPRLGMQTTLTLVRRVAQHDGLVVLVAETTYGGPYSSQYHPLFQLHPHCLVVSWDGDHQRVRLVFKAGDTTAPRYSYLTLVGPRIGRHPHDNIILTSYRIAQLYPLQHESGLELEERMATALGSAPDQVGEAWTPRQMRERIGGSTWSRLAHAEAYSFLQTHHGHHPRLHWGLQGVLRNVFPMYCAQGAGRVDLLDWRVVSAERTKQDRLELIAEAATRGVTVELRLALRHAHSSAVKPVATCTLHFELPLPDENGELIIGGQPYGVCFDRGEALPESSEEDATEGDIPISPVEDEDEFEDTVSTDSSHSSSEPANFNEQDDEAGSEESTAEHSATQWINMPPGQSFVALWSYLAERKFQWVAHELWRTNDAPTNERTLRFALRRLHGSSERPFLISVTALWKHLVPRPDYTRAGLPTARWETATPPPWACVEASAFLEEGQWAPVSCARLAPDGQLRVPRPMRKGIGLELALSRDDFPPRARGSGDVAWLAEELARFAPAPVGSIKDFVSRTEWSQKLTAVRVPGERLEARISPETLQRLSPPPIECLRVVDIAAPHSLRDPNLRPVLLAKVGEQLPAGAAWLNVPRELWAQGASIHSHTADVALARMLGIDQNTDAHVLHLGPDEKGVVVEISLVERPAPLGGPRGWRAFIRLCRRSLALRFFLADGRSGTVTVSDVEDLPYDTWGNPAELLVFDPELAESIAALGGHVPLTDLSLADSFAGEDGELLDCAQDAEALVALEQYRRLPCAPDTQLRFRLLDGDGIPSDGSAPQLTHLNRQWLAAAHPRIGGLCSEAEGNWSNGLPPYLAALQRLCVSAGVPPLKLGPLEWQLSADERSTVPSEFDPTITRTQRATDEKSRCITWRCSCGTLQGREHAILRCDSCGSRALERPVDLSTVPLDAIELPFPVFHPWRVPAAAALLGLRSVELKALATRHDSNQIRSLLLLAASSPYDRATRRLDAMRDRQSVVDVGAGLHQLTLLLKQEGQRSDLVDSLWLHSIPVLPELYRIVGAPPGSGAVLAPGILLKYRRVRLAVELLGRSALLRSRAVETTLRRNLQTAVDELFGDDDTASSPQYIAGNFAALLRRLWPTTRPAFLPHTVPGQFRSYSHSLDPSKRRFGYFWRAPSGDAVQEGVSMTEPSAIRRYLVTGDNLTHLPEPKRSLRRGDLESWRERAAFQTLLTKHSARLAALADACRALDIPESAWTGWSWPSDVPRAALGTLVLRHTWRNLENGASAPSVLVELLELRFPLNLPASEEAAVVHLSDRLSKVYVCSDIGTKVAAEAIAMVLAGWRTAKVTPSTPLGGTWHGTAIGRRIVPDAANPLWQLLPGYRALCAPRDLLAAAESTPPLTSIIRAFLRLPFSIPSGLNEYSDALLPPGAAFESESAQDASSLALQARPKPRPDVEDERLVPIAQSVAVVYFGRVSEWLHQSQRAERPEQ